MPKLKIILDSRNPKVGDFLKQISGRPLTSREASVYLGLSLGYFTRLAAKGCIPRYRLSPCRFFYTKNNLRRFRRAKLRNRQRKYLRRHYGPAYCVSIKSNLLNERKG